MNSKIKHYDNHTDTLKDMIGEIDEHILKTKQLDRRLKLGQRAIEYQYIRLTIAQSLASLIETKTILLQKIGNEITNSN